MRIVITSKGEELLNSLNIHDKQNPEEVKKNLTSRNRNKKNIQIKNFNLSIKPSLEHILLNPGKNNKTPVSKTIPTEIHIKQAKLHLPKHLTDKYINNPLRTGTYLPVLPEQIIKKNIKFTDRQLIQSYTIRDIISDDTFFSINNTVKSAELMKDKLTVIDENNFRTPYQAKTKVELVNEKLEKQIGSEKIYVIKYLNSKKNISANFINKLNHLDDDELQKINKISQKVVNNEDSEKILKNILKERIQFNKNKKIIDFHNTMTQLDNNFAYIEEYKKKNFKHDKKILFFGKQMEMRKTWAKYNVDKLSKSKFSNSILNNASFEGKGDSLVDNKDKILKKILIVEN